MDLNGLVLSDEGMPISLSMPSGPSFLGFESSLTMIYTSGSSPSSLDTIDQANAPGHSHAFDALPSKLLSDYDVCHDSPPEPQDVYKQTLRRPDIYAGILDNPQEPAEAPSLDSVSQDLAIEDFNSSPPSSPSMSTAYRLSSSPIPSSSPPPQPSFQTPPTSPPSSPIKDTRVAAEDSSNIVAPSDDATTNTDYETRFSNESDKDQRKLDSNDVDAHRLKSTSGIPHPKRPTIAAHRLQQKKLAKPFRSPVLPQAPKLESKPKATVSDLRAGTVLSTPKEGDSQEHVPSSSVTLDSKIKYRTPRAATQFKSPLSASNASDGSSLVRLTPTIQALERKLQILKRAVKVREDVQEEVLEGLVKKWTEAGREVAWEVWNLVKDNAGSDGGRVNSQSSKKRTFKGSWGWESPDDAKKPKGEEMERNWGWDVVPISSRSEEEEEGENDGPKHTLGTMLRQLGVSAETLGWDDEEGSFIDR